MKRPNWLKTTTWMASGLVTAIVVVVVAGAGCDKRPSPPTTPPPQAAATDPAATSGKPTTQELVNGTYKSIILPGMPLSMKVPESWKLDIGKTAPLNFLTGPTPSSDLTMIQLAEHATVKPEQIDIIAEHASKPQQDEIQRCKLRDVGKMKVLERLAIGNPETNPQVNEKGEPRTDGKGNILTVTTTPVRWTITAFVPYQGAYSRYDLSFVDLNTDQYAKDKEMLERIINSLRYEGGGDSGSSPTTSASSQ